MAKIKTISRGTGNVSSRMTEVECEYNTGFVNGEKYVCFSTFGSASRQNGGSASQVLHIDKKSAEELVKILKQEFDL